MITKPVTRVTTMETPSLERTAQRRPLMLQTLQERTRILSPPFSSMAGTATSSRCPALRLPELEPRFSSRHLVQRNNRGQLCLESPLLSSSGNRTIFPVSVRANNKNNIPSPRILLLAFLNEYSVSDGVEDGTLGERVIAGVQSRKWNWRGYSIRYQCSGESGPALVLIHGFGANSDHWRKNIPFLAKSHRVYSLDLIGYGYSDKPNPRKFEGRSFYTFETWATQINDFCRKVVKDKAFFICNSIGGVVGLQAAVMEPEICRGVMVINISLRMLHIKKQPWYGRPLIRSFQNLLRNTTVGKFFFRLVATPESVKSILSQCYHDPNQVTDELVQIILQPGLEPGAADVFLEFICYSGGPLPEELLPQVKCPVLVAWGEKDPWEPIELGSEFRNFDSVEDFVVIPEAGHCPQDETPHLVNPLVESFVARHAAATPATTF